MSRNIGEAYRRAVAIATDDHNAPGKLETAVDAAFGLDGSDPFDLWCRDVLIRCVGLVKCPVTLDAHRHFDVPSLTQGPPGWSAWVMPVFAWGAGDHGEPLIEDLVAWCEDGKHAGRVWTMMGYAPAFGLDVEATQRTLKVFTQPKLWLLYWLQVLRQRRDAMMSFEAPWPQEVAALVLDPARVRWKPEIEMHAQVPLTVESIDFADSPALRDYVARAMRVEMPKLPRLRAAKTKTENAHGPTPKPSAEPARAALVAAGDGPV